METNETQIPSPTNHVIEEFADDGYVSSPRTPGVTTTSDGCLREYTELNRNNALDCNLTELGASMRIDEGYMSHTDWIGHASRYGYAMKQLEHGELKQARTVLDVGCGTLQMPHFFYKNRFNPGPKMTYFGLDLRATRSWLPTGCFWKSNISLVRTDALIDDLTKVPHWPGQFDLVVSFEMLEHVPRAQASKLVERLFGWTKPGGVCLLSTPNAGVSKTVAENHVGPDGVREWTFDDKLAMVRAAGFKVKAAYGTFCGVTRLPDEFRQRIETDPFLKKAKEYLWSAMFTSLMAPAFPRQSNNALFHLVRPA